MAREITSRDLKPILDAAQKWIRNCLIDDGSIFSSGHLWTPTLIEEVKTAFVDHPDIGGDSFSDKLQKQMQQASPPAQRLMAEMLWAILVFPSNVSETTKREQIRAIWNMSGEHLPDNHSMLSNAVLAGIGSGGQAYNNLRWMELRLLIELVGNLKQRDAAAREKLFSDYDEFVSWISTFPAADKRQFKHMLRYFAYPDRVERMSSNNHRFAILAKFGIATEKVTKKWGDQQLDEALLKLREKLQTENPGKKLDFYEEPLRHVWYKGEHEGGKNPPNTLPAPFNHFFASFEEANQGFDLLANALKLLGVNPAEYQKDNRICLSLAGEKKKGDRFRLNFGNWAILTFSNLSAGENRIEFLCRVDQVPATAQYLGEKSHFSEKVDGQTFCLATCTSAAILNPASEERRDFENSLSATAKRFGASLWPMNHEPKLLRMVYDLAYRHELLNVGLDTEAAPEDTSGTAYWWLNANPDIWDFRKASIGSIQTYTSRNQNGKKRRIYEHFLAVKPGDLMLGYITTPDKEVVGLCEITKSLHKTEGGEVFEFKKIEQFKSPVTWAQLKAHPSLADCEPLQNNQGSLFALTKSQYDTIRDLIDAQESEQESSLPQPFLVADALDGLFLGKDQFDAMLAALRRKKALVLQGPPGVGKTFVAHRLAYALMKMKDKKRVTMVQFHPSYSYEDFIQGYRPTSKGSLERRNGVFYEFARQARNDPTQDWVFIIDEINRGNLAKVFGELLMLLEADKRGPETQVSLTYSEDGEVFYLPENLFVIGTMNTADRSLAMVDYALRRRFAFHTLTPALSSPEFAAWFLQQGGPKPLLEKIVSRIIKLNSIIDSERDLGERFRIGHSFFCPGTNGKPDEAWYNEIITGEIAPLLEEYFDSPQRVKKMVDDLLA